MPYTPQSWVTGDQVTAVELTDLSEAVTSASSGIADMAIDQTTSHLQVTLADGDLVDAGAVPAASDATVAPILQDTATASYAAAQSAAHAALDTTIAGKVAKGTLVVNVADHGAVADFDGSTGTDSAAAIQAAIDAAPAGARVFVPAGRYYCSQTINLDKVIDFDCASGGTSNNQIGVQLAFAPGVTGITASAPGPGLRIGPFNLVSLSTAAGTDDGIRASMSCVILGANASQFGRHGINFTAGVNYGGGNVNLSLLEDVRASSNRGDGIHIEGSDANACVILKPSVFANYGWGINIQSASANVVICPHADQTTNSSPGAYRDSGLGNWWQWPYSEGGEPLLFDSTANNSRADLGIFGKPTVTDNSAANSIITINDSSAGTVYSAISVRGRSATPSTWSMSSDVFNAGVFAIQYASGPAGSASTMLALYRGIQRASFGAHVYPLTDATFDIGSGSNRWRNAFISGYLRVGSYATTARPAATTAGAGATIFDTTLGKPIWSNGSAWVDATGTAV